MKNCKKKNCNCKKNRDQAQTHSERAGLSYGKWLEVAHPSQMSELDKAHARTGSYGNRRRWV